MKRGGIESVSRWGGLDLVDARGDCGFDEYTFYSAVTRDHRGISAVYAQNRQSLYPKPALSTPWVHISIRNLGSPNTSGFGYLVGFRGYVGANRRCEARWIQRRREGSRPKENVVT